MLKRRSRENESSPKKAKVQRVLDFLLDDDSEDNVESEITVFMRERTLGSYTPVFSCSVNICSVGKNLLGSRFDCCEALQQTVIHRR